MQIALPFDLGAPVRPLHQQMDFLEQAQMPILIERKSQSHAAVLRAQGEKRPIFVGGNIKGAMREANNGVAGQSRDLWQVEPTKLRIIPGLNPRIDNDDYRAHVREIVESMKEEGYYQHKPMAGFVGVDADGEQVIFIYEGETRLAASLVAMREGIREEVRFEKVPVSVSQEGMTLTTMLIEKWRAQESRDFGPYEAALFCHRFRAEGLNDTQIAKQMRVTATTVANAHLLMQAPAAIRAMVVTGQITFSFALDTVKQYQADAERVLRETIAKASAGGKAPSAKFLPGATYRSAVSRSAPVLLSTMQSVHSDPGFATLSQSTRDALSKVLEELEAIKKEDPEVGSSSNEQTA